MKTILIAHNYSEISFAAMSYHLAGFLAEKGHQVIFISHKPYFEKPEIIDKGAGNITVMSWPTINRPTSLKDFLWYVKIWFRYKPYAVIGHFVGSNITISVSKLLSLGKVKTFEYYHTLSAQLSADNKNSGLRQQLSFFRKKFFYKSFCDYMICPSDSAKSDLEAHFGIRDGIVILNPISDRFTEKATVPGDNIIISYLGRLDPSKGVSDMIKAFLMYKSENPQTKINLRIAGNGAELSDIKALISNNSAINYCGSLAYDEVDDFLNSSHFTIIPSKFDNLPTVGLESMMNQTALLISNATGLTNYLADGKECFKFEATPTAMKAMFERVEYNFEKHAAMGIDARNTFLRLFSTEEYCKNFYEIIA
ncbi:glycosyltransferase family 4 protein [Flavobacterium sp. 3HN19-14]|uniref:glycosyltransferase family 4 protein n=1 Tax=Flavobacterium sp. 3HN19-14 TaxID=3448133 RepID=UPI003EDE81DE